MELIILIVGLIYLLFQRLSEPPRIDYWKMYAEKYKAASKKTEGVAAQKVNETPRKGGKTK